MHKVVVVTKKEDFNFNLPGLLVISAKDYLVDPEYGEAKNLRLYNLCRSYRYQSSGYYVSLLAEARGHRVYPNTVTIQDFKLGGAAKILSGSIEELIQEALEPLRSDQFTLSIYFGRNLSPRYDRLCRALMSLFEAPLMRAKFVKNKRWALEAISPISYKEIPENHLAFVQAVAAEFFSPESSPRYRTPKAKYSLAFLLDPEEKAPPSDEKALRRFEKAAKIVGLATERITKDEISKLDDFDALFIRVTTAVNHFTYRFSRKASALGLVVVDDPLSIVRCSNKVYLAELLSRKKIPAPKTLVVGRDYATRIPEKIGLPCVLKKPDSSFSMGVIKVHTHEELLSTCEEIFNQSDFLIAQEFLPTDYDWRVGVLNGQALFACKYYMARGHWQIYNWKAEQKNQTGSWETFALDQVPVLVLQTAVKAARLIGDGFYGVDLKVIGDHIYVIEINDNPSIESDVEDQVIKDSLYLQIMNHFLEKIRHNKSQQIL